jgi:DUF971 family protein
MGMSSTAVPRPKALSREGDDRLVIDWSDGHRSTYTWSHLREHCPCAACRGELGERPNPLRILKPSELEPRPPLAPVAMSPVGHYAYKIVWNDGHDTGIFTLENLRELCQCPECAARPGKKLTESG